MKYKPFLTVLGVVLTSNIAPAKATSVAEKSCIFTAIQELRHLPDLKVKASRAMPSDQPSPVAGATLLKVEIDGQSAGQTATFAFLCLSGGPGQPTAVQALGIKR